MKAPGAYGFSGMFLKAYWHIMKSDFYALCNQFHEGKLDLASINDGLITLIPKVGLLGNVAWKTKLFLRTCKIYPWRCIATRGGEHLHTLVDR